MKVGSGMVYVSKKAPVAPLYGSESPADHRFTAGKNSLPRYGNVTAMSFPDEVYESPLTAANTGISFRTMELEDKASSVT
jgi:hypothetical protein